MKRLMLALALLGSFPFALSAQVSKEDLKKLVSAGISDEVILSFVKSHGPVMKLSPEDLIDLKKVGLKESLLADILKVSATVTPPAGDASTAATGGPYYTNPSIAYVDQYPYYYPYYYSDYGYWGYPWWGLYYGGRYWGYRGYPCWNRYHYGGGYYGHPFGWGGAHGGGFGGRGGHGGGHR